MPCRIVVVHEPQEIRARIAAQVGPQVRLEMRIARQDRLEHRHIREESINDPMSREIPGSEDELKRDDGRIHASQQEQRY